jgi:Fe-S cluster biogenesis protein NfuA
MPATHASVTLLYGMSSPIVGLPLAPQGPAGTPPDDDAIYQLVSEVFREQINPQVAKHGGQVELIDVQDRTVVVRMKGGCQGCGMATVTLRQGIEASLRRMLPGLAGIRDITDHSAGTKPYYAPNS